MKTVIIHGQSHEGSTCRVARMESGGQGTLGAERLARWRAAVEILSVPAVSIF